MYTDVKGVTFLHSPLVTMPPHLITEPTFVQVSSLVMIVPNEDLVKFLPQEFVFLSIQRATFRHFMLCCNNPRFYILKSTTPPLHTVPEYNETSPNNVLNYLMTQEANNHLSQMCHVTEPMDPIPLLWSSKLSATAQAQADGWMGLIFLTLKRKIRCVFPVSFVTEQ